MIVYHGSPNKFNTFDYSCIGQNGTSEGIGFYCTDNKTIAEGYAKESRNNGKYEGYLYTIEFNGKKSLSSTKRTITKSMLKKYLLTLQNNGIDYLSNYNDVEYYGVNKVLIEATEAENEASSNDVDLICSICHGSGNTEICLKTLYNTFGYDSIILQAEWGINDITKENQNLYIALVNEAIMIKNIENVR